MEKATAAGGLEKSLDLQKNRSKDVCKDQNAKPRKNRKALQNGTEGQLLFRRWPSAMQAAVVCGGNPRPETSRHPAPAAGKEGKTPIVGTCNTGMCQIFSAMNGARARRGVPFRPAASRPHWLRFDALRVEKQEKASGAGGRPHNTCQVFSAMEGARTQSDKTRCRRGFGEYASNPTPGQSR